MEIAAQKYVLRRVRPGPLSAFIEVACRTREVKQRIISASILVEDKRFKRLSEYGRTPKLK